MCKSTQGTLCPSPMKIHYWPFFKNFSQKVNNPKWPLDDLWPHICWCLMCDSTQRSLRLNPMEIHQSMWIQWPFFKKINQKVNDPQMTFDPTSVRSHVQLYPRIIVSKSHGNTSKYVDTVTIFQNINQKVNDPKWPLDDLWPHFSWGHKHNSTQGSVSNSHKNMPKHVDTVTLFFKNLYQRSMTPDDLWSHFCWGHMCNSTQGSL